MQAVVTYNYSPNEKHVGSDVNDDVSVTSIGVCG